MSYVYLKAKFDSRLLSYDSGDDWLRYFSSRGDRLHSYGSGDGRLRLFITLRLVVNSGLR